MRFFSPNSGVIAVTSERSDGPMGGAAEPGESLENRRIFLRQHGITPERTVFARQAHGAAVLFFDEMPEDGPENADGLVSLSPAVAIAHADCFPLFFAALPQSSGKLMVGIAHAGWRGALGGIASQVLAKLDGIGAAKGDIRVAIGPGIRSCCFDIKDDANGLRQYRERGCDEFIFRTEQGGWRADLPGIIMSQLEKLGIAANQVEDSGACTVCDPAHRFFSWRRGRRRDENMISAIYPARGG